MTQTPTAAKTPPQKQTKAPSWWHSLLPPKKQVTKPSFWQSGILLMFAALTLALVLGLWLYSKTQDSEVAQAIEHEESLQQTTRFSDVGAIDDVGIFERQVNKVSFDNVVRQIHSQHPEFKDAEYVVKYKHAWTIQVMSVTQEEVIADYLAIHPKRKQFTYFRSTDADGVKHFILTFDNFNDEASAKEAMVENEFNLPSSITPFAIPFKDYIGKIDDYHLQSKVRDYTRSNPREVNLIARSAPSEASSVGRSPDAARFSNYYRNQSVRRSQQASRARVQPQQNAFAEHPMDTPRYIQPKSNDASISNTTDDTQVIIETVPQSVKQEVSQAAEPVGSEAPTKTEKATDSISELINNID